MWLREPSLLRRTCRRRVAWPRVAARLLLLLALSGGGPAWCAWASSKTSAPASPYSVLGVSKSASDKDITKAYRRLCLKHHPDKGGDEETFKKISEAYQVLSDPQQREQYDTYGTTPGAAAAAGANSFAQFGAASSPGASAAPFHSFFQSFGRRGPDVFHFQQSFGSRQKPSRSSRQSPSVEGLNSEVENLLRRMMMGQGLDSSFPQARSDPFQHTGRPPQSRRRQGPREKQSCSRPLVCTLSDLYQGKTKRLKVRHGNESRTFTIKLNPHWKSGTRITYPAANSLPTMVFVVQEKDPVFTREGRLNVKYEYPTSVQNLSSSASAEGLVILKIPLLDGTTLRQPVHQSTLSSGRLTIPDQGIPSKDGKTRGSLIVTFHRR